MVSQLKVAPGVSGIRTMTTKKYGGDVFEIFERCLGGSDKLTGAICVWMCAVFVSRGERRRVRDKVGRFLDCVLMSGLRAPYTCRRLLLFFEFCSGLVFDWLVYFGKMENDGHGLSTLKNGSSSVFDGKNDLGVTLIYLSFEKKDQ